MTDAVGNSSGGGGAYDDGHLAILHSPHICFPYANGDLCTLTHRVLYPNDSLFLRHLAFFYGYRNRTLSEEASNENKQIYWGSRHRRPPLHPFEAMTSRIHRLRIHRASVPSAFSSSFSNETPFLPASRRCVQFAPESLALDDLFAT